MLPELIGGIPVYIDRYLCQPSFVRWRRSHRKKRINKKWHKRYGKVIVCDGYAYHVRGGGIIACPCAAARIKDGIDAS